ncbi:MAG: hypothetical protein C0602_00595 [Denitrovibrio sp.]|nr:MAG: hypothetical protein C0602_00595 [Denitrovibrio sp.]
MVRILQIFMVLIFSVTFTFTASAESSLARIIGGELVANGELPFQVAIGSESPAGSYNVSCGGTLISSTWIVTAAHCMEDYDTPSEVASLFVLTGTNTVNPINPSTMSSVSQVIIHPDFHDAAYYDNDIALIKLSSPVDSAPIGAISTSTTPYYTTGTSATVSGWGDTDSTTVTSYPDELYKVNVPVTDYSVCDATYSTELTTNMICAGYQTGGKDACQGDSGGPLFVDGSSIDSLIGIVSYGTGCAQPDFYGVYTKVENYTAWIESNTGLDFDSAGKLVINEDSDPALVPMLSNISSNSSYDIDTSIVETVADSFSDDLVSGDTVNASIYAIGGTIESMNLSNSSSQVGALYTTYAKLQFTVDTGQDKDVAIVLKYSGVKADRYKAFICPQYALDNGLSITCTESDIDTVYNSSGNCLMIYLENNNLLYDENQTPFGIGDDKIVASVVLARSTEDVASDKAEQALDDLISSASGGGCSAAGSGSAFSFALMFAFCGAFVLRRKFIKSK